jgi:beta-barrel assembly-enhancing protease
MAFLYDGGSGVRHEVGVSVLLRDLVVERADGDRERLPVADLRLLDRSRAGLVIERPAIDGWRLRVPAPVAPEVDALFPRAAGYGGWIDRIGLWPAVAGFGALSALVLALGYFAPTLLAPLVPRSVEQAYGDALVGDFGGKYCSSALGDAALKRLTARLDPQPGELNVRVVDLPVVNAAALPAGNIVLFDKLFEEVETPEELAGILAHEIAHVRRRHVTAAMLREFGISIFTTALGGTTAGNVEGFVALTFTRRAEGEADGEAIAMMERAAISPAPTARFFKRLKKLEAPETRLDPAFAYLSSHPLSGARAKRFESAARRGAAYTPALTDREWAELRAICSTRSPGG